VSVVPAVLVGALFAVGTYMILGRTLTRTVIGFAVLAHGVNLLLLAAGAMGDAPIIGTSDAKYSDPLPQAFVLTAIVISFGITAFLLTLSYRSWQLTRDDEVEDDIEDRRIARLARRATASAADDPTGAEDSR
jgi:multicomponent Na+:H+ antiporter subunit C